MLSRHLGKSEVEQVAGLINKLFDVSAAPYVQSDRDSAATTSTVVPLHPRNKHLH
jgi:hypothetical protein